tara:strand:+ start:187 stop:1209 length:1023 start_codon:yes stop_codon:yes gene_type:complete
MKVIVDFVHIPHINLFKNVIKELNAQGKEVEIICLDRGANFKIAKNEYPSNKITMLGSYKSNLFSIIFQANIWRFIQMIKLLSFKNFDIGVSAGSFILGFCLKILNIPNIQITDDLENRKNKLLLRLSSTALFYPLFDTLDKKNHLFKGLKEWSYLSPDYFSPDISKLEKYNVNPKEYIFVREVSVGSSNYLKQERDLILKIAKSFPEEVPVLLSLENKNNDKIYPKNWTILKEPIEDVYSLIYFSKVLVSSGDSMSREGAMLGVPSVYCGIREMAANKIMIDRNILFHIKPIEVPEFLLGVFDAGFTFEDQTSFRKKLLDEWDDVTKFILDQIESYGGK